MKATQTFILFLGTMAFTLSAADSANRLSFPMAGFSITPLEVPPGRTICQPLIMALPATGNFAGNVNVQIQPYSGTIAEYVTVTLKQFKDIGVKVIEQKKAGTSGVVFEYGGEFQGRSLHWYARAEKVAGHVYLATATTTEQEWPRQGVQLKGCVDSLRIESGEPGAPPNAAPPHR